MNICCRPSQVFEPWLFVDAAARAIEVLDHIQRHHAAVAVRTPTGDGDVVELFFIFGLKCNTDVGVADHNVSPSVGT